MNTAVERHGDAPAGAHGDAGRHIAEREDQAAMGHIERFSTVLRHFDLHDAGAFTDLGDNDVIVRIEALKLIVAKRIR